MLDVEAYLALRERPEGRAAMRQTWHDLTFLHFSAEPEEVQRTLPKGLTVDTYPDASGEERAWVGLVPFRMTGIRFEGTPAVPGCHAFPETNVRTYVHRDGERPGVWFYSLDAVNPFACAYARRVFGLPYHSAQMTCRKNGDEVEYRSRRRRGGCGVDGCTHLSESLAPPEPGSLEFFLIERYVLYAERRGRLFTGQVHHPPYQLRSAAFTGSENLVDLTGISPRPWESCLFSERADVEVFSVRPV